MDKFASGVLTEINKFRENPLSVEKRLQSFKLGLSRLRANDPFIKEIESFIRDLGSLRKNPPFELNDELCKAAQSQIEKPLKVKLTNSQKTQKDTKIIVPLMNLEK